MPNLREQKENWKFYNTLNKKLLSYQALNDGRYWLYQLHKKL